MAISLITSPLPVQFSRNAVEVRFNTPDKVTAAGAKNRALLIFTTFPTSGGETLEVEYTKNGETFTRIFTFAAVPDADAYEIETYSGSGLEAWLYEVIAGLQGDPNLAADWTIGYFADDPVYGVLLQAQFEDDTNIAFTATGFNRTISHPASGAVGAAEENYRLSAWLFLGRNSSAVSVAFDRTPEIELDADAANTVDLNLTGYLDAMLYDYEEPPTTADLTECTVVNRPAYLLFGQKWGNPVTRQKNFKSNIFRVIKGGLNPRDYAEAKSDLPGWLEARFLTNRYERKIRSDQTDYLYWVSDSNLTQVIITSTATLDDGTTEVVDLNVGTAVSEGTTYKMAITQAACLAGITGTVVRFAVKLIYQVGGVRVNITPPVIYTPDDDYLDCIFEYENSQGVIESWKFKGERSIGHEITKALYRTELPFAADVEDNQEKSYNERDKMTMACTTGPLSKSESRAFPDFLRSRYVWLVEGGNKVRVRIPEGKHIAERWTLTGNHARGGEFTVELGESLNVSREVV